jgi:transforming growth factor-beta-induced protein
MSRKRTLRLMALPMAGALVFAACGNDDGDDSSSDTTEAAETTAEEETTVDSEMAQADIVETAAAAGDFTTLAAALEAAGLVETLQGEGPFTVFAPTDAAFEAALADLGLTAEELLADTELLTSVLTYHVVEGEFLAEDVVGLDGQQVETVNGETVTISVDGDTVMVNDANVVETDVVASNGVIHVIDAVLVPAG